jgi:hypothetical protein
MKQPDWVRLPSRWINVRGLRNLCWGVGGDGSNNTAALMALVAIAHAADQESGVAKLTYDDLCRVACLSRAKLSNGLDVLERLDVVKRAPKGRSTFKLVNFDWAGGWAMLSARSLYSSSRIAVFEDFKLRSVAELNALKLFFLFVAMRNRRTNMAHISYDKISDYSGVERTRIKTAISLLASLSLVHVERVPSQTNELGVANAYRIVGVEPRNNMATRGRSFDAYDFDS